MHKITIFIVVIINDSIYLNWTEKSIMANNHAQGLIGNYKFYYNLTTNIWY